MFSTKKKGWLAEWVACSYLVFQGHLIVERNFQTSFGELDIIAKKKQTFVIIEVKSRYKKSDWHPLDAIDSKKRNKIRKLAKYYIAAKKLFGKNLRMDVLTVEKKFFWFSIKHYKNVFSLT